MPCNEYLTFLTTASVTAPARRLHACRGALGRSRAPIPERSQNQRQHSQRLRRRAEIAEPFSFCFRGAAGTPAAESECTRPALAVGLQSALISAIKVALPCCLRSVAPCPAAVVHLHSHIPTRNEIPILDRERKTRWLDSGNAIVSLTVPQYPSVPHTPLRPTCEGLKCEVYLANLVRFGGKTYDWCHVYSPLLPSDPSSLPLCRRHRVSEHILTSIPNPNISHSLDTISSHSFSGKTQLTGMSE